MSAIALYAREVKRFQKIALDTVVSPLMSLVLYLAVFGVVVGERVIGGVPYVAFVYTGLLAMTLINASFSNPSFALIIGKNIGTIADLQVAPLRPFGIALAYAFAALVRGLITVAIAIAITVWFVPGLSIDHSPWFLIALVISGLQFGLLGVTFGMWAKNFEAMQFAMTFIMQPLIFLSGVFYPIKDLPGVWATVASLNPIHHTINLARYGLTGYADGSLWTSLLVISVCTIILGVAAHLVTKKKLQAL